MFLYFDPVRFDFAKATSKFLAFKTLSFEMCLKCYVALSRGGRAKKNLIERDDTTTISLPCGVLIGI